MIRWRRRNEGFEWREYVRTTILVRRKERRQHIKDIQAAIVESIKNAGKAGFYGGMKGAELARKSAASAALTSLSFASSSARKALSIAGPLFRSAVSTFASAAQKIAASLRTHSALDHSVFELLDRCGRFIGRLPGFDRFAPHHASLLLLAVLVALAGVGTWWSLTGSTRPTSGPSIAAGISTPDVASPLEGRAIATAGDRLKIGGTTLKLDGVEAPELGQSCEGPNGKWRCGAVAKDALALAVRGHRVSCEITGRDISRVPTARCTIAGNDVAAPLVQFGHLFAESGLFTRYGGEEYEAMLAKAGIWSGEPVRPRDFRAKLWQDAALNAPDGCPIKGRVTSGARVYVLPWSPSYAKVRVNASRGERWFCSEEDAQAAGWKPQSDTGS